MNARESSVALGWTEKSDACSVSWRWLHVPRWWYYRSETMHDLPSGDNDLMFRDDKLSIVRQSKICSETKHNMFWDNGFAFWDITHPILRQWALHSETIHFAFQDDDILWSATLELLVWSYTHLVGNLEGNSGKLSKKVQHNVWCVRT